MKSICSYVSDIGSCRTSNQDAVFLNHMEQNGNVFTVGAIFDGIGGLECGELASETLAASMGKWFQSIAAWIDIASVDEAILYAHFKDEAELLNETIRELIKSRNVNMGTTMSAILVIRRNYYIIQVGDSRIYKWNGYLEQITVDDVIVKSVNGHIRKYLSNYMGQSNQLIFSEVYGSIEADTYFLFCSDGFYHKLRQSDLTAIKDIDDEKQLEQFLQELVHIMMQRGEPDNISAGIIKLWS